MRAVRALSLVGACVYAALCTLVALVLFVLFAGMTALGVGEMALDWYDWPPRSGTVVFTAIGCVIAIGGTVGQYLDWRDMRHRPPRVRSPHFSGPVRDDPLLSPSELVRTGLARFVGQDDFGKLWRIDRRSDEPIVLVEVVNSTADPDDSYRSYLLRVPPSVRTPREAIAWTFGFTDAGEYLLAYES